MLKTFVHLILLNHLDDGLNFYFKDKSRALNLMDFIQSKVVVKIKQSNKLVSHDPKKGKI